MNWNTQIDTVTAEFNTTFGALSPAQLNWKPNAATWSVAQNIDHLIQINKSYYPVIDQLKAGKLQLPWMARVGFMVSFFGKMILKSVHPDSRRKMKTFPIWEPSSSDLPGDILHQFGQHQEELKRQIATSAEWIQQRAVIHSPANKKIVYSLDKAFDIILTHELRHLEQAKELLVQIKNHSVH